MTCKYLQFKNLKMIIMNSNKLIRNLIVLFSMISILLIVPASFALENNTINQEIQANEMDIQTSPQDVFYVNATGGSSAGSGSADDPVSTISEGLNLAKDGGTLYLTGRFTDDGNFNLTLENTPKITFIGRENAIIDGNFTKSFALVKNGEYDFENISFINNYKMAGNDSDGGVFCNLEGTLSFTNCIFENNTAFAINRANGGAIDNSGKITITCCTFKNNIANVTNSSGFRKNAADGGALSNLGILYVYNSTFIENKVLRNGGAIRTQDHSTTYIDGCKFIGNIAAYHLSGGSYGGAIYTWDCGLDLYNSIFENNRIYDASGYGARGGALSLNRGIGKINIKSCQFINNTADGIATVDGQSLYFESVEATVNYCTIDTSIFSISQSIDLNWNWWAVNSSDITPLIENLPSSAAVKKFAELRISSDAEKIEVGKPIGIEIGLYWNGTENQNNITSIPIKTAYLDSVGGTLSDKVCDLTTGSFKTTFLPEKEEVIIIAKVNNFTITSNLSKAEKTEINVNCDDIVEGENALVSIETNSKAKFCLIEVDSIIYYAELADGKGNAKISGLTIGKHEATIKVYDDSFNRIDETGTAINVNDKPDLVKKDTRIDVKKAFTFVAVDGKAGEQGGNVDAILKDSEGKPLANKTVQIALDGEIYDAVTDDNGVASLKENISSANTYACAIIFTGDDEYNASPLAMTKVTVTKKSTALKASSKSFKAKAKTKTVSITLKTSKNKYDGKTYLSKNKKITLKVNGKTYSGKTNSKGIAKIKVNLTKKGKYTATIKFAGDNTYKASSKTIKITIK